MRFSAWNVILAFSFLLIMGFFISPIAFADEGDANQPKVPFKYAVGYKKYQEFCSGCHGKWLDGTKQGPPLVHGFYKPSHHGDAAFYRAALNGVRAHHWKFGNMPPVNGVSRKDMDFVVPFIRWFQQAKGLY